jgi:succinate dehydrogenase / fumarate reductase cytochrome b subunit
MSSNLSTVLKSSIFRKQLSALTGLALVGFVIAHLAGNLFIFMGPEAFNEYAESLQELGHGKLVWIMRSGLIVAFLIHLIATISLVWGNSKARATRYEMTQSHGNRKFATRAMKYTGAVIFIFLIFHLLDFTLSDKTGDGSVVNDENLGLYGLVFNDFQNWFRVIGYIIAVSAVGLHLTHAIQSMFQTFGLNHEKYTPVIKKVSLAAGIIVAVIFSAIPLYLVMCDPLGV